MAETPNNDDMEFVRKLRHEWRNAFNEGMEIRDKKGYVDNECRSKMDRIDGELNKKMDQLIAGQDAKIKALAERSSRMPGAGGGAYFDHTPPGLGQMIVESDEFKSCTFQGKFALQIAIKGRIRGEAKSAGAPVVPGGG